MTHISSLVHRGLVWQGGGNSTEWGGGGRGGGGGGDSIKQGGRINCVSSLSDEHGAQGGGGVGQAAEDQASEDARERAWGNEQLYRTIESLWADRESLSAVMAFSNYRR